MMPWNLEASDATPSFHPCHRRRKERRRCHANSGHQQHHRGQDHQVGRKQSQRRRDWSPSRLDALGLKSFVEFLSVPITDQISQFPMFPPTEERLGKLEAEAGSKNLKGKGVNQVGQQKQERREEWPQVLEALIKQLTPVKRGLHHPANHSDDSRSEEVLVKGG
jgi:hypothetical protein